MTENDYIAEYVKEKHPGLLGADYAIWKVGKIAVEVVRDFRESMKTIKWEEIAEEIKKQEAAGGNEEDES